MQMLNRIVPALLLLPCAALADVEFGDNVPREVVEQFIVDGYNRGPVKLYSDIPDAFPPFTVPAGFSVLATADQGYALRAVLKTELDEDAARTNGKRRYR